MANDHAGTGPVVPWPRAPLDPVDAQGLLALAFENSPLGMTLTEVAGSPLSPDAPRPRAVAVNRAFADMIGYTVEDLLASSDQGRFTHEADRMGDPVHVQALLDGREQATHWDKRYLHADGHVVWARVSLSVLRGPDGQPRYLIAQIQDITEQRAQEAQLLERAERDALTGLLNRSAFDEHAHEQVVRCARYGEHASLLLLDVDDLKQINDRYGHVVGDRALVAVADVLRRRLRAGDVAARLGGDEFVVLLPHTDRAEAQRTAHALASAIAATTVEAGSRDVSLRVSVGSAEITSHARGIESTLAEADRDMYTVKRERSQTG